MHDVNSMRVNPELDLSGPLDVVQPSAYFKCKPPQAIATDLRPDHGKDDLADKEPEKRKNRRCVSGGEL
jgi:hypothetical protein